MDNFSELVEKIRESLDNILGKGTWTFTNTEHKCDFSEKLAAGRYSLRKGELEIARFRLVPMINQCGINVSTEAWVHDDWRHKGLGRLLNSFRIDMARHEGYSVLLCTDVEQNEHQRKILLGNGWTDIFKFVNKRSKNTVFITVINL